MQALCFLVLLSTTAAAPTYSADEGALTWENGDFFEGDIILNREQELWLNGSRNLGTRGGAGQRDPSGRWPDNTMHYNFDDNVSERNRYSIRSFIEDFQRNLGSCVRFVEIENDKEVYHARFAMGGGGCGSSYVGKYVHFNGRYQPIKIANHAACLTLGVVQHEVMHALGVWHEQSRPDRDDYVTILKDNLIAGQYERNFKKLPESDVNSYNLPYDFASVMHYGKMAGSKNGKITIQTKDPKKQNVIGQRARPTGCDLLLIKRMYGCSDGNTVCEEDNGECNFPADNFDGCPSWASWACTDDHWKDWMQKNCATSCNC